MKQPNEPHSTVSSESMRKCCSGIAMKITNCSAGHIYFSYYHKKRCLWHPIYSSVPHKPEYITNEYFIKLKSHSPVYLACVMNKDIETYQHINTFISLQNLEPSEKSPWEPDWHLVGKDRTIHNTEFHCKIDNGISLHWFTEVHCKIDEIYIDSL